MKRLILVLGTVAMTACAAPPKNVVAPGFTDSAVQPMTQLIEGPHTAPPVNDIPESERIAWFEAQRPRSEPVRVYEREPEAEQEPVRQSGCAEPCHNDWWWAPLSISLGFLGGYYWGGGGCGHHH